MYFEPNCRLLTCFVIVQKECRQIPLPDSSTGEQNRRPAQRVRWRPSLVSTGLLSPAVGMNWDSGRDA